MKSKVFTRCILKDFSNCAFYVVHSFHLSSLVKLFIPFSTRSKIYVNDYNELHCHSVRNCQATRHEELDKIDPEEVFVRYFSRGSHGCNAGCMVGCSHKWRINEGSYAGETGDKIEYLVTNALGLEIDNMRMDAICHLFNEVIRFGLDVVEVGTSIGLLMELWQKGLLSPKETDGLEYNWGDVDVTEETIRARCVRKMKAT